MNIKALQEVRASLVRALSAIDEILNASESPLEQKPPTAPSSIPKRIVRLAEVKKLTGVSRSFIYKGIKEGTFPAPISLGARAIGWECHQIEIWIQNKLKNV